MTKEQRREKRRRDNEEKRKRKKLKAENRERAEKVKAEEDRARKVASSVTSLSEVRTLLDTIPKAQFDGSKPEDAYQLKLAKKLLAQCFGFQDDNLKKALKKSGIGMVVGKLSREHPDPTIKENSEKIVVHWKSILDKQKLLPKKASKKRKGSPLATRRSKDEKIARTSQTAEPESQQPATVAADAEDTAGAEGKGNADVEALCHKNFQAFGRALKTLCPDFSDKKKLVQAAKSAADACYNEAGSPTSIEGMQAVKKAVKKWTKKILNTSMAKALLTGEITAETLIGMGPEAATGAYK